ncbi:MAG: metallophosphoesterase family protein [Bacteroidales bacterium]|nr:metallophosphoesterase family protein [Bacteroidales bacterium]
MRITSFILASLLCVSVWAGDVYTVIANPGENASKSVRLNWHSNLYNENTFCFYTECSDIHWARVKKITPRQELCTAFDSMYSKTPQGENIYEQARFIRNTVELKKLKPGTRYMYRIGTNAQNGETRYFHTAPECGEWSAAIISDFHAYTPLPKRVKSAMAMLDTLEARNGSYFDVILHVGDIIAWGGSYSFWKDLYDNDHFKNNLWAGVNGNHDNMDRTNKRNSKEFFRNVNNNPLNGYNGQEGVCYHFTYGDVLFVMLNNEEMRSDEGLAAAQEWVRNVIKRNKKRFVVVMEHYQWFYGTNGKFSQYSRWQPLFDECGVDLAISANNHVYARTNALYNGVETDGSRGTVYLQTSSSDNERGQALKEWTDNKDIIKYRWSEGGKTVSGILLKADSNKLSLTLYDRYGKALDNVIVKAKTKKN